MSDEIAARVKDMREAVGYEQETYILGMMTGLMGWGTEDARHLAEENLEKYDNANMPEDEAYLRHLEYLKDMFKLDDLDHARQFSEFTEEQLDAMYRKLAIAERAMGGGILIADNEIADKLIKTIEMEAAKQNARAKH